jgi:hypothetical protein
MHSMTTKLAPLAPQKNSSPNLKAPLRFKHFEQVRTPYAP